MINWCLVWSFIFFHHILIQSFIYNSFYLYRNQAPYPYWLMKLILLKVKYKYGNYYLKIIFLAISGFLSLKENLPFIKGILFQNLSSISWSVSDEWGDKPSNKQRDRQTSYYFRIRMTLGSWIMDNGDLTILTIIWPVKVFMAVKDAR